MGGDDAGGAGLDQLPHQGERAGLLVDRVGAPQDFVENDKEFFAGTQPHHNLLQPLELGKEVRLVVGQRVAGPQTGEEGQRREGHAAGTHGGTHAPQQVVDTYGAQVGALAGHVGPGDDLEGAFVYGGHVVADAAVAGNEGMPQRLGLHHGPTVEHNPGEDVVRMIVAEGGQ